MSFIYFFINVLFHVILIMIILEAILVGLVRFDESKVVVATIVDTDGYQRVYPLIFSESLLKTNS